MSESFEFDPISFRKHRKAYLWMLSDWAWHRTLQGTDTRQSEHGWIMPDPVKGGWKCPACKVGNIDPKTFECSRLKLYHIKEEDPITGAIRRVKVWGRAEGCGHNDNPTLYTAEEIRRGEVVDPYLLMTNMSDLPEQKAHIIRQCLKD